MTIVCVTHFMGFAAIIIKTIQKLYLTVKEFDSNRKIQNKCTAFNGITKQVAV